MNKINVFYTNKDKIFINDIINKMSPSVKLEIFVKYLFESLTMNDGFGAEIAIKPHELMFNTNNNQLDYDKKLNIYDFTDSSCYTLYYYDIPYSSYDIIKRAFGNGAEYIMHNIFYIRRLNDDVIAYITDLNNKIKQINERTLSDDIYHNQLMSIIHNTTEEVQLQNYIVTLDDNYQYEQNIIPPRERDTYYAMFGNGTNVFGADVDIAADYYTKRICIRRYQDALYSNSMSIAKCLVQNEYDEIKILLGTSTMKIFSLLKEHYMDGLDFDKNRFATDFSIITTDYKLDINAKSIFFRQIRLNDVYEFINGIIIDGGIRNKLFVLLTLSKLIHCTLIRKMFLILNNEENKTQENYDEKEYYMFGLKNEPYTSQHVETYCAKHELHYKLIKARYDVIKKIYNIKKNDTGSTDLHDYLSNVAKKDIKKAFLLYMYDDYKYNASKSIRLNHDKKTYVNPSHVYPKIDKYEPLYNCDKKDGCQMDEIGFLDRGVDWSRSSVLDYNKVYLESFKNGEPMLTGGSGHTADILVAIGYINNVSNIELVKIIKKFTMICVICMFPRKDHSPYEMYRSIQMFDILGDAPIWKCPTSSGGYLQWLCSDFAKNTQIDMCLSTETKLNTFLTNDFASNINQLLGIILNSSGVAMPTLIDKIKVYYRQLYPTIGEKYLNKELFKIFYILVDEERKKKLDDANYAYYIQETHITLSNYIYMKLPIPSHLEYYDIYKYEDDAIRCVLPEKYYIYKGSSLINIYMILRYYFSGDQCYAITQ